MALLATSILPAPLGNTLLTRGAVQYFVADVREVGFCFFCAGGS